jgi:hypothetical protein
MSKNPIDVSDIAKMTNLLQSDWGKNYCFLLILILFTEYFTNSQCSLGILGIVTFVTFATG